MRSGPAAAAALMLAAALFSGGCGDEQSTAATPGRAKQAATRAQAPPSAADAAAAGTPRRSRTQARRCRHTLGDFLDALESLRNSVAVGVSYETYLAALDGVRGTYAAIDADALPLVCLAGVATPAEAALNAYVEAANEWGECLAGASCDSAAIEPRLQRSWRRAGNLIP